jgi:hypothetical protein
VKIGHSTRGISRRGRRSFCQPIQRLRKRGEPLESLNEREDIALSPTHVTAEDLLARIDPQRRPIVVVEGATHFEFAADFNRMLAEQFRDDAFDRTRRTDGLLVEGRRHHASRNAGHARRTSAPAKRCHRSDGNRDKAPTIVALAALPENDERVIAPPPPRTLE